MTKFASVAALAAGLALASVSWAQGSASPVGLWKNIDDETGKPKALIRIVETNGQYMGRIEKLFTEPGADPNPRCVKCDGELKDQPIVGMTILSGLKQDGDVYDGGRILDPHNGKVYKSKMTLLEGGRKLNVRGYVGLPMLGRSQVWVREE